MTDLIIVIAITLFLTIPLEVWLDPILWKKKLNEKRITTSLRGLIIIIVALILKDDWLYFFKLVFVQCAVYTLFDQVLNIFIWKILPVNSFIKKLFYHGNDKTKNKWDRFFQWTGWCVEVFIKSLLILTSILVYITDDNIFISFYYWVIDLF